MPPRARALTAARTGPQEYSADAVWGRGLVRADSLALDERAKSAGSFGGPATPFAASASPGEARKFRRQGSEVRERRALCARTKTGAVFPPCSRAGGAPVQVADVGADGGVGGNATFYFAEANLKRHAKQNVRARPRARVHGTSCLRAPPPGGSSVTATRTRGVSD